jgi:hypothetical protein
MLFVPLLATTAGFLGAIGLKDLMKEHLVIRQRNTIAATGLSPMDPDTRL